MTTKRILTLATVSALAVAATTIVATAALGAAGTTDEVRLHLGNDSQQFVYGGTTQNVGAKSNGNCTIKDTPAPTIMDYTVTGTRATPGFNKLGIGVSSASNPNGTPCAQIDPNESLTLTAGAALQGKLFYKVRLDLEMTGNAVVNLTFARVAPNGSVLETSPLFTLQTGPNAGALDQIPPYEATTTGPTETVGACAAGSNSGPNSTINDNCQWTVEPGINFNRITLATPTTNATVSLEGGGDFGPGSDRDSVFYIVGNGSPTANDDTVTTKEDTPVTGNVLTNDTDPEDDPLTATLVTGPSHGTVTLASTGAFTYTPNANYNGPDSFTYAASDGNSSRQATVSITVTPDNDPPVATNDTVNTDEDTAATFNVLTNDTDVEDGNALTVVSHTSINPAKGSLVDNGGGSFTYTPEPNDHGTYTFDYTAKDTGGLTSTATVTINVAPVNDAPVANDDSGEINQTQIAAGDVVTVSVLANDTDLENNGLFVESFTQGAEGSVAAGAGGTLVYKPGANFEGTDTFTYRAVDSGGALSDFATVTITEVICTNETVTDNDNGVIGTFTRLGDTQGCKRFSVDAQASDGEAGGIPSITFKPEGDFKVNYRGFVTFGSSEPPVGELTVHLRYDPTGGTTFRDVLWCENRVFSPTGLILSADMPNENESWCIASVTTGGPGTDITTTWQVFGLDDPRFV